MAHRWTLTDRRAGLANLRLERAIRRATPRNRIQWIAIACCGAIICLGLVGCRRDAQGPSPTSGAPQGSRPAESTAGEGGASPSELAAGGAGQYVDEATCAECHPTIAESFSQHPMGQSLAPVAEATEIEVYSAEASNPFDAGGFRYSVVRDAGLVRHVVQRIGRNGELTATDEKVIDYAVGSGHRGRSYLWEHDGFVFMSPITWYPDRQKWDLSPGYEVAELHFRRGVIHDCLYCHANRVEPVSTNLYRYKEPVFRGHSIGCQRCHGPGEQHVAAQQEGTAESPDSTIVNPSRLSPPLREQVCQQCHLSAAARVVRHGKERNEFRPGLPLNDYLAIFSWHPDLVSSSKFVGQVEQMYASRCFQASAGAMGCISCHDPHQLPAPEEKNQYFRQRCLTCHQPDSCSLDVAQRTVRVPDDSCHQCHMPTSATHLRHVATTDHRILRNPEAEGPPDTRANATPDWPLVPFPPGTDPESIEPRDRAIALLTAHNVHPERIAVRHLRAAVEALRAAIRRDATDWGAAEALAHGLVLLDQNRSAYNQLMTILSVSPNREFSLAMAGQLQASVGEFALAEQFFRRAVRQNPYNVRYQFELAFALSQQEKWAECLEVAEPASRMFPENIGLKQLLVASYLHLGNAAEAERVFQAIEAFDPEPMPEIRAWYEQHPLRRRAR